MIGHLIQQAGTLGHSFDQYNTYQIITLTVGMLVWTYLYLYLAYRGLKTKFVQMPLLLACGNIAWEFLWGFVFQSQYQLGVLIGMGSAFLIDCTIFYGILRYMKPYTKVKFYANNLKPLAAFGVVLWLITWYTFKQSGMDTDAGGASGNLLNALIAVFWVNQVFTIKDINLLSVRLGWAKLLADIPIALFMMSVFPEQIFAYSITWISVLFDVVYIYLYYERKKGTGIFKNYQIATQ
jgi:hypothetical protein